MYKTQRFKKKILIFNFFFFRKSMTSVCNSMLLKFFLNKFSFLSSIAILNFCRQSLIAVFRNMEIFQNLRCLNTEIFESPYFNTWRFKNLCVLKHGGFVRQNCSYFPISVFQYCTRRFENCPFNGT